MKPGDRVSISYLSQPNIEAVVIGPSDTRGFVEVEEDYLGGKNQFIALESKCTVIEPKEPGTA